MVNKKNKINIFFKELTPRSQTYELRGQEKKNKRNVPNQDKQTPHIVLQKLSPKTLRTPLRLPWTPTSNIFCQIEPYREQKQVWQGKILMGNYSKKRFFIFLPVHQRTTHRVGVNNSAVGTCICAPILPGRGAVFSAVGKKKKINKERKKKKKDKKC